MMPLDFFFQLIRAYLSILYTTLPLQTELIYEHDHWSRVLVQWNLSSMKSSNIPPLLDLLIITSNYSQDEDFKKDYIPT